MKIYWHVTKNDKICVETLVATQKNTKIVQDRYSRNLSETKSAVTKERFWRAMVCMRLTTLARSGPNTKLTKFQCLDPFPLCYKVVQKQISIEKLISDILREYQVGTHRRIISEQLSINFKILEDGEWSNCLTQCNRLLGLENRTVEAEVADYIRQRFSGFGPKQSRNLLQTLGLTRYEIPIDSRVITWLNSRLNFPITINAAPLSDKYYYNLIMDGICKLCEECNILPCILDASIFGANEDDTWSGDELRY
jgi:hypothetical protein